MPIPVKDKETGKVIALLFQQEEGSLIKDKRSSTDVVCLTIEGPISIINKRENSLAYTYPYTDEIVSYYRRNNKTSEFSGELQTSNNSKGLSLKINIGAEDMTLGNVGNDNIDAYFENNDQKVRAYLSAYTAKLKEII